MKDGLSTAGRPALPGGKRILVMLDRETADHARLLGAGNLSAGLRLAVACLRRLHALRSRWDGRVRHRVRYEAKGQHGATWSPYGTDPCLAVARSVAEQRGSTVVARDLVAWAPDGRQSWRVTLANGERVQLEI